MKNRGDERFCQVPKSGPGTVEREGRAAGAERAAEIGVPAGDRSSGGWRWRRPAPPPDESACLEEFEPFVARWSRVLNPAFGRIPDFRKRERCAYDAGTIAWTILPGMFLRRKSRVRMDSDMSVRAKDGGREAVGDLAWAKDVTLGEGKGVVSFNVVRCAERAKGDGVSRPGVRRERINDKPPYRGRFATNFDVWDADSVPTRYMRRMDL